MAELTTDGVARQKRELRAKIRAARTGLSEAQLAQAGARVSERLRELVLARGVRSLSCYLPVRGEPDTNEFLTWAGLEGIDVLLPASREDGLLDWIRPSGEGTVGGVFGVPQPLGEVLDPFAVGGVDLMLIPAAAVDLRGERLGWGRGYFDRNLASLPDRPPVFAIVHDHEVLDALPREPHDAPLDGIVTPERVIEF